MCSQLGFRSSFNEPEWQKGIKSLYRRGSLKRKADFVLSDAEKNSEEFSTTIAAAAPRSLRFNRMLAHLDSSLRCKLQNIEKFTQKVFVQADLRRRQMLLQCFDEDADTGTTGIGHRDGLQIFKARTVVEGRVHLQRDFRRAFGESGGA